MFVEARNDTSVGREPHALSVESGTDTIVVHLEDGRSISAPLEWFPRLRDSSEADRNRWRLIGASEYTSSTGSLSHHFACPSPFSVFQAPEA
jgi:uncharacterized protein DUF2442